jgi:hypothetical protein
MTKIMTAISCHFPEVLGKIVPSFESISFSTKSRFLGLNKWIFLYMDGKGIKIASISDRFFPFWHTPGTLILLKLFSSFFPAADNNSYFIYTTLYLYYLRNIYNT